MGERGPPPKPKHLAVIDGTFRPALHDKQMKTDPLDVVPDPPEWLDGIEQRKAFTHYAAIIHKMGVLSASDIDGVATLAIDHCEYLQAQDEIEKNGGPFQYREQREGAPLACEHPAVAMKARAHARMQAAYKQYYLTPAARARADMSNTGQPEPKGGGWTRGRLKGSKLGDR